MSTDRDALAEALWWDLYGKGWEASTEADRAVHLDMADRLLASPQFARLIAAAKAEGIVQGRGELRSAESAAFKRGLEAADHAVCGDCAAAEARGAARVREAVEGVLREGPDTWTPYDSRDTGETFLAESVTDFTADLRAALAAETPTESAEEAR